ncbi:hypothetical protein RCL1_005002 [Eukaryota sp. TZLM3-RCL]
MFTPSAKRIRPGATPLASRYSATPSLSSSIRPKVPITPRRAPQSSHGTLCETSSFSITSLAELPLIVADSRSSILSSHFIFPSSNRSLSTAYAWVQTSTAFVCWSVRYPMNFSVLPLSSPSFLCSCVFTSSSSPSLRLFQLSQSSSTVSLSLFDTVIGPNSTWSNSYTFSLSVTSNVVSLLAISGDKFVFALSDGSVINGRIQDSKILTSNFHLSSALNLSSLIRRRAQNTSFSSTPIKLIDHLNSNDFYLIDDSGKVFHLNCSNSTSKLVYTSESSNFFLFDLIVSEVGVVAVGINRGSSPQLILQSINSSSKVVIDDAILQSTVRNFENFPNFGAKYLKAIFEPNMTNGLISFGQTILKISTKISTGSSEIVPISFPIHHSIIFVESNQFLILTDTVTSLFEIKQLKKIPSHGTSELADVIIGSIRHDSSSNQILLSEVSEFLREFPKTDDEIDQSFSQSIKILIDSEPNYWSELGQAQNLASSYLETKIKCFNLLISVRNSILPNLNISAEIFKLGDLLKTAHVLAQNSEISKFDTQVFAKILADRNGTQPNLIGERELFFAKPSKILEIFPAILTVYDSKAQKSVDDYYFITLLVSTICRGLVDSVCERQSPPNYWFKPLIFNELSIIYSKISVFISSLQKATTLSNVDQVLRFLSKMIDFCEVFYVIEPVDSIFEPLINLHHFSKVSEIKTFLYSYLIPCCSRLGIFSILCRIDSEDFERINMYISKFRGEYLNFLVEYLYQSKQFKRLIKLTQNTEAEAFIVEFLRNHPEIYWQYLVKISKFEEAGNILLQICLSKIHELPLKSLSSTMLMCNQLSNQKNEMIDVVFELILIQSELYSDCQSISTPHDVILSALEKSNSINFDGSLNRQDQKSLISEVLSLCFRYLELYCVVDSSLNLSNLIVDILSASLNFDNFISFYPLRKSDSEILKISKDSITCSILQKCPTLLMPTEETVNKLYQELVRTDKKWQECFKFFQACFV